MTDNAIPTILLLITFIVAVWASINSFEEGTAFLSFIFMLEAIWILFAAYTFLRDSLEKRFEATS